MISGAEFILLYVILKAIDVGSGGKKNTVPNVLPFHSICFYTNDSYGITQAKKDLRTLNNVTDLFDGGCVS
jgi:hypothetical protein